MSQHTDMIYVMKYLLLSLIFISCVEQPPAEIEYVGCDEGSYQQKNLYNAMNSLIKVNCEDLTQFKCSVSEFSPNVVNDAQYALEHCPENSLSCLRYDKISFDTSAQKDVDTYATDKDFEPGGQYNYLEVTCVNKFHKGRDIAGVADSIDAAYKIAYEKCKI
jgi:hypothetical protein